MFCLDKKTNLQIDMIEILDESTSPISAAEIAKKMKIGTVSTILSICRELNEIISKIYIESQVELIINHKGISLIRNSTNLVLLYNYILTNDLGYEIMKHLILEREVNVYRFCIDKGVSESTLRRKMKQMNREVNFYDFKITCSNSFSIKGNELKFRIFSFIFLCSIHRQMEEIAWIEGRAKYISIAKQVSKYLLDDFLAEELNSMQLQLMGLWIYITNTFNRKGMLIHFSQEHQKIVKKIDFPKKPESLSNWHLNDWEFFLIGSYCYQLFDFPVKSSKFDRIVLPKRIEKEFTIWISTFECHFEPINQIKKQYIIEQLKKIYIADLLFRVDQKLFPMLDYDNLYQIVDRYPTYLKKFEDFFSDLSFKIPTFKLGDFKIKFLRICLFIYPLEKSLPKIRLYYFSDQYSNLNRIAEESLSLHFRSKYDIRFVSEPGDAEWIISTTPSIFFDSKEIGKMIVIRSPFLEKDLITIEDHLQGKPIKCNHRR